MNGVLSSLHELRRSKKSGGHQDAAAGVTFNMDYFLPLTKSLAFANYLGCVYNSFVRLLHVVFTSLFVYVTLMDDVWSVIMLLT